MPISENEKLSKDYTKACIKAGDDPIEVRRAAKVILYSRKNIPKFHEKRKNLEKLNVPQLGTIRRKNIEVILNYGVEKAIPILNRYETPRYDFEMKLRDVGARTKPNRY